MVATLRKTPASESVGPPSFAALPANENLLEVAGDGHELKYWPLVVIGAGIVTSALWCGFLAYCATLLLSWLIA